MKRQKRNPRGECHDCGNQVPHNMRYCRVCWIARKRREEGRRV